MNTDEALFSDNEEVNFIPDTEYKIMNLKKITKKNTKSKF
jgi:hypothetical protein